MPVELIGQALPVERLHTGLNSLDRAFNFHGHNLGIPVRVGYEFYAPTHTGKSTFVYALSSLIASLTPDRPNWVLCDLEGFDPTYVLDIANAQKMDGGVYICDGSSSPRAKTVSDEILVGELIEHMKSGIHSAAVLDSIANISPVSEQEGDVGEANMGRRAKLMANATRQINTIFRKDNAPTFFGINHFYPGIGTKMMTTPGGEVKNYILSVRARLQGLSAERYEDGSFVVNGFVEKNRWGGGAKQREFSVFMVPGVGIHRGLTAYLDCKNLGLLTITTKVKLGDKSWWAKELRENWQDEEMYQPFYDALEKYNQENK